MAETLPVFRYHPDPVRTGSVKESATTSVVCGRSRNVVYCGSVYAVEERDEKICPRCIADGTAAQRLHAEFTDVGWGVPDDVPTAVLEEVSRRTPGFSAWQQDHWLYHCSDACAFLGRVGRAELDRHPDALDMLIHENDSFGWTPERSRRFVDSLDANGEATAYLFRCLACGRHLAYSDSA